MNGWCAHETGNRRQNDIKNRYCGPKPPNKLEADEDEWCLVILKCEFFRIRMEDFIR